MPGILKFMSTRRQARLRTCPIPAAEGETRTTFPHMTRTPAAAEASSRQCKFGSGSADGPHSPLTALLVTLDRCALYRSPTACGYASNSRPMRRGRGHRPVRRPTTAGARPLRTYGPPGPRCTATAPPRHSPQPGTRHRAGCGWPSVRSTLTGISRARGRPATWTAARPGRRRCH